MPQAMLTLGRKEAPPRTAARVVTVTVQENPGIGGGRSHSEVDDRSEGDAALDPRSFPHDLLVETHDSAPHRDEGVQANTEAEARREPEVDHRAGADGGDPGGVLPGLIDAETLAEEGAADTERAGVQVQRVARERGVPAEGEFALEASGVGRCHRSTTGVVVTGRSARSPSERAM